MTFSLISIVIPTLNSASTISSCLEAIRSQETQGYRVEIIIADAGSTDATLDIARKSGVDRIVPNPLRTGEAGKTAGIKVCSGDLIALIDSDNILDDPHWISRMVAPFSDPEIVAAEPLCYTRRPGDPTLTRYFAMLGMSDPLCLFTGNYDRMSMVTGRWTDLPVPTEDKGDYLKLALTSEALPTIGANGFVFRRSLLDHVNWDPYFFDIDVVQQAVAAGYRHVAKVKCGIVHLYCRTWRDFARKQDRRVRDYLFFSEKRTRTYPWQTRSRAAVTKFIMANVLQIPLWIQAARGYRRQPDPAWLCHVPACGITCAVYGWAFLLKMWGVKSALRSRGTWHQG